VHIDHFGDRIDARVRTAAFGEAALGGSENVLLILLAPLPWSP